MNKKLNHLKINANIENTHAKKKREIGLFLILLIMSFVSYKISASELEKHSTSYTSIEPSSPTLSYAIDDKRILVTTEVQTRYEGPTKASDTLWSIAARYLPDDARIDVYQAVGAIYRLNPEAFRDENIHGLIPGSFLALPTMKQIEQENTKEIAKRLRLDRVIKLEKEALDKEALNKEEKAKVANSLQADLALFVQNQTANSQAIKNEPIRNEITGNSSDSNAMGINIAQNNSASIRYDLADDKAAIATNEPALSIMPLFDEINFGDISHQKSVQLNKNLTRLPIDVLILQEELTGSVSNVDKLTKSNQLLTERLIEMEKELNALKIYIESDEDVNQEIQEFIEVQRELNTLVNAESQFSWENISANTLALVALGAIPSFLAMSLIAFFFSRRLRLKAQTQTEKLPVKDEKQKMAFHISDFMQNEIKNEPILCINKIKNESKQEEPKLKKEREREKEKEALCLDEETWLKDKTKLIKEELEAIKPEAIRFAEDESEAIKCENVKPEDVSKDDVIEGGKASIRPTQPEYVMGLAQDEIIDLEKMSTFEEDDALKAVLAENAMSDLEDREENKKSPLTEIITDSPIIIHLDEAIDKKQTVKIEPINAEVSIKQDAYQALLNELDVGEEKIHPDFNLQMDLAKAYIEMQDFEGAVELLQQVLKSKDPHLQQQAKEMLITLK